MKRKCFVLILTVIIFITAANSAVFALDYTNDDIETIIKEDIESKRKSLGLSKKTALFASSLSQDAGSSGNDWFAFFVGRCGFAEQLSTYREKLEENVIERYKKEEKLDEYKATEWHRISLTLLALGGDPTDVNGIDLIADGTYNRGLTEPLDSQGVNGAIWGLITLDAMRYKVPENAYESREDIIKKLLLVQDETGHYSFEGAPADVDITAMAIQALVPYYNDRFVYKVDDKEITVRESIDKAIAWLSDHQKEDGSFSSMGESTSESSAQVIVALCSLGIDPANDARFLKNGNSALDGLMLFKSADGGFAHVREIDPDNPQKIIVETNAYSTNQALYALTALYRYRNNLRPLYDLRAEPAQSTKNKINKLNQALAAENISNAEPAEVEKLYQSYLDIPLYERKAVFNYYRLEKLLKQNNIVPKHQDLVTAPGEISSAKGEIIDIFAGKHDSGLKFNFADLKAYEELPSNISSKYYQTVERLYNKLQIAENAAEYGDVLEDLTDKKVKIEQIQSEIEAINKIIANNLYPLEQVKREDLDLINDLILRAEKLSVDDRKEILGYEELLQSQDKLEKRQQNFLIVIISFVVLLTISLIYFRQQTKDKNN